MKPNELCKRVYKKIMRTLNPQFQIDEYIRGGAQIGKNFHMYSSTFDTDFVYLIEIGDDVTITHSHLIAHDASTNKVVGKPKIGKIRIGNNVFIGYGCIILPNVTIGNNVIIGAGSIVTRNIPSNSVAVGNPCRVIGNYDDFKQKHYEYVSIEKEHPTVDAYASMDPSVWEDVRRKCESTWVYNNK